MKPAVIRPEATKESSRVVFALDVKRLLSAPTHKASLRLTFPVDLVDRWLPRLYPL